MLMTAKADSGRFQSGAYKYAELERKLGNRPEFAAVARYIQIIARHSSSSEEAGP
jgi:hypothetical protein